ncbi:thioredoxin [Pedobacter lusitanus]|uniref:Thioredoxin n=2 Tax=Pedobacter lusitanus TaxID=1503925 RepID=A0A0D0GF46_9SPHI|nr:thioredoxin [Pedobacter lusitanus]
MNKIFNRKNIVNGILIVLFLILLFVPPAKALVLEGLMKIGFFKPDTAMVKEQVNANGDLSGIKFKDVKGNLVDLGELKGKVIFLNFWATWCPPCLAEMPSVNALYEKFKNDKEVVFILVDADSQLPKAQKFMDKKGFQLPVYAVASEIPEVLFQGSLPTTVVFDRQGRISYNESGAANYGDSKFIEFINKLKTSN